MNIYPQILILLLAATMIVAAPVPREPRYTIDLSQGRSFEYLLKTGIPLESNDANQVSSSYSLENACICFRFPNGLEFEQYVELLVIYVEQGKIRFGHTNGMIMSVEEAYGIVSKTETMVSIPLGRLDEWIAVERNRIPGNSPDTYRNGSKSPDRQFSFTLAIGSSINLKYRASVELDFGFEGDSVAPLNTVFKRISLDPLEFHEREEAWEGAEEEFKAAQAAMKAAQAAAAPAEDPATRAGVRPPATFAPLWPWLACGFLLLLLLLMAFKQYRDRGRRSH